MKHVLCYSLLPVIVSALATPPTQAQSRPSPVEESLPEPIDPLPAFPPTPDAPIQLDEEAIPELTPRAPEASLPISFFVDDIQIVGNTLFQREIEDLVSALEGQEITLENLVALSKNITDLYFDNGYVSSGAFLPTNQDLAKGVVQMQVVEGEIEQVQINGLGHLKETYVRDRIARAVASPLNVQRLEEGLQKLQVDPLLQSVNAELTVGRGPGQNILILDLVEADPVEVNLAVDNYRAPRVGSLQGGVGATHMNLLGFGDRLSASYDLTEGLDIYEVSYSLPVNGLDGTVQLRYANADSNIVTTRFADAGIRGENETISFGFNQPLANSLTNEFALGVSFDLRESRSFILDDQPFNFSAGEDDGVSKVRALRFSQEWANRTVNTVLAARSRFSVGLDIFDATVNNTGTDGRFFAWLGQFQWVQRVAGETVLVTRVNAQLTPDSLLSLERFSVGGIQTVRGYAQNEIVVDNAITASTELRWPVTSDLQVIPFIDAGGGWNNRTPDPDPSFLLGLGLGLRWQPFDNLTLRLDYGIPLISPEDEGNSLQENGLYFSLSSQPF